MNSKKIQSVGCNLDDPKLKRVLEHITSLSSLAKPVVCLPDIHIKEKTESPCSFVVATAGTIVPHLTAPSVGCGMGVITTSLTRANITDERLQKFYAAMQQHRGPSYGVLYNILLWLGLKKRPHNMYDISEEELAYAVKDGARFAVKKYALPPTTLDHVEYQGDAMDEKAECTFPVSSLLPRAAFVSGKHDIGYGFTGNHFLEIQYVEKISDVETARSWNLREGQIVVMYHGGGGAVSHYIGRYFARREKDSSSLRSRVFQFAAKFLFHFGSKDAVWYARERWHYYFSKKQFPEIPANTQEGRRLLAALAASLNYSYVFRLAIAKRVIDALGIAFGEDVKAELLWDAIHNSIRTETIDGKNLIVHRHTATRIFEERPVIISGFNNTNSYLGVGCIAGENSLFSADHGAGETIKRYHATEISKKHTEQYTTDIYTSKPPYKKTASHITNEGLDAVTKPLEEAGVIRAVAYMRPIAVFKG